MGKKYPKSMAILRNGKNTNKIVEKNTVEKTEVRYGIFGLTGAPYYTRELLKEWMNGFTSGGFREKLF